MSDPTRRGSGSGSLAARYASRSHKEQEVSQGRLERGELAGGAPSANGANEEAYPVRMPTDPGVAHVPHNLTHGTVVDTNDKKRTRFTNEVYLRSHPELGLLLNDFLLHVLAQRPARPESQEEILDAAVDFFTREGEARYQKELQQQQQRQ